MQQPVSPFRLIRLIDSSYSFDSLISMYIYINKSMYLLIDWAKGRPGLRGQAGRGDCPEVPGKFPDPVFAEDQ